MATLISRALAFVAVFAALQFGWQLLDGGVLHRAVIDQGIVAPAALIAKRLTPDRGVHADGSRLRQWNSGLNVVNGCDGMETFFLLVAAFSVTSMTMSARLLGILAGSAIVYLTNMGRILVLFYANSADQGLFDLLHGFVTPLFMVATIAGFFFLWMRRSHRQPT